MVTFFSVGINSDSFCKSGTKVEERILDVDHQSKGDSKLLGLFSE